jgi:hypothetical protein
VRLVRKGMLLAIYLAFNCTVLRICMPWEFEILRIIESGQPIFQGSAQTLEDAKVWLQRFSTLHPGEYLVVNRTTGEKILFRFEQPERIQ